MKRKTTSILLLSILPILFNYCSNDVKETQKRITESHDTIPNKQVLDSIEKLKMAKYDPPFGLLWETNPDTIQSKFDDHYNFLSKNLYKDVNCTEYLYEGEFAGFYNCVISFQTYNDTFLAFGAAIPVQGQFPIAKTWKAAVDLMSTKYGNPYHIVLPKQDAFSRTQFDSIYPETKNKDRIAKSIELINSIMSSNTMLDESIQNGDWEPLAVWNFSNAFSCISVKLDKPNKYDYRKPSVQWITYNKKIFNTWSNNTKYFSARYSEF